MQGELSAQRSLTFYFDGGGSVGDLVKDAVVIDPAGAVRHYNMRIEGCNNVSEAHAAIRAVLQIKSLNLTRDTKVALIGDNQNVINYMNYRDRLPSAPLFRRAIEELRSVFDCAGIVCSLTWAHVPRQKNLAGRELAKIQRQRKHLAHV
ncbi:reverse transcriptase-like protein [Sphingobium sp. DC-2]|uniref:reverse transcriptase-like protein n=1 Tax=Sphingobium sp. DC-2 TaxID=1303256 RepID=UPI0004C2C596|nr:reverse transcriptase-like protein [Sphingobium sp. DC-2]